MLMRVQVNGHVRFQVVVAMPQASSTRDKIRSLIILSHWHQVTYHSPGNVHKYRHCIRKPATYFFGLVRARTSLYVLKSRKVHEEPRIQKKLIPKFIHFQEE